MCLVSFGTLSNFSVSLSPHFFFHRVFPARLTLLLQAAQIFLKKKRKEVTDDLDLFEVCGPGRLPGH